LNYAKLTKVMLQQVLLYILTFISGLLFGSFLNLVSDRILSKEKILTGRSKCDSCKKPLQAKQLIPLLSFMIQKGKCAYCKEKLSWYYPASEIITGLMFVGAAHYSSVFQAVNYSTIIAFAYLLIVGSAYVVLLLTDFKFKMIPNKIIYPTIIFVLLFMIINSSLYLFLYHRQLSADAFGVYLLKTGYFQMQVYNMLKALGVVLLSSTVIAAFFAFLVAITKGRGMGGGDIRLGFLIGLFNGFPQNIIAIFLGFILGATLSLVLVMLKIKTLKDTVPFGPFLIAGSVIALVWGTQIWNFYIHLF